MSNKAQQNFLAVLTALFLAVTYIAGGFVFVTGVPFVTKNLSQAHSTFDTSPYAPNELAALAVETRNYTVDEYGRKDGGNEEAAERIAQRVLEAAKASIAEKSPTADRWSPAAKSVVEASNTDESAVATMEKLAAIDSAYALDEASLRHLNDVYNVVNSATMPLMSCAILALFCMLCTRKMFSTRALGYEFLWSGSAVLVIFVVLGLWAMFSFNSMFTLLHTIFFSEGTWMFPSESLLICMYPINFWMSMGTIWLTVSCALAALSLVFGIVILRRTPKPTATAASMPDAAAVSGVKATPEQADSK